MDSELIKYIIEVGGIGVIFGVLMWLLLKEIIKQGRQDRVFMEDRLTTIIEEYNQKCDRDHQTQQEFMKVLTELNTWLRMKNGH